MRVASAHLVPGPLDQREPFAVMDGLAELTFPAQQVDGDFLQTLPTQSPVEVLDSQLRCHSKRRLKLGKYLLVTARLGLGVLGQGTQLLGATATGTNALGHRPALVHQRLRRVWSRVGCR